MRMLKLGLAVALLLTPHVAIAQDAYLPGRPQVDSNPPPVKPMCWTGTAWAACSATNPAATSTQGTNAAGTTDAGNPVTVAGVDGNNVTRKVRTDNTGYLAVTGASSQNAGASGQFFQVGGVGSVTAPTAVTTGNGTRAWFGLNGQTIVGMGSTLAGNVAADGTVGLFSNTGGTGRVLGTAGYSYDITNNQFLAAPTATSVTQTAGSSVPAAGMMIWDDVQQWYVRPRTSNAAQGGTGLGLIGVGNLGWDQSTSTYRRFRTLTDGSQVVSDLDGGAVPWTNGAAANAILFSVPTTGYAGVSFQPTGTWSGTITTEGANDASTDCQTGGTWAPLNFQQGNSGGASFQTSTTGVIGFVPAIATCIRARVSAYTSGTIAGIATLRSIAPFALNLGAQVVNNNKSIAWPEANNVALAASAVQTGATRDIGAAQVDYRYNMHRCFALSGAASVGGLLEAQGSNDGTTWVRTISVAAEGAGVPVTTNVPIFFRYNRCRFINGTTAQTSLYLNAQYGE